MRYSIKRLEIVQKKHALKHALKGANRARKTLKIAGKEKRATRMSNSSY